MTIDSRTTFEVWELVIYDEVLSRAVFDGSYRALAEQRGYTAAQIAVLDWFAAQPGMRWNVENLRFRAALETVACVMIHLPRTARLLSRGDDDWLQDICYEYLSYHRWDALGHRRLTESERFGEYVRERIMKRRITPPHLDLVLELELAVVDVHKKTAAIAPTGWPPRHVLAEDELAAARPKRGIAQRLVEQPLDLRAFMSADQALTVEAAPGPVIWFIHLSDPKQGHRMAIISEGARELLDACSGELTSDQIASSMDEEFGLPREHVMRQLAAWFEQGILVR